MTSSRRYVFTLNNPTEDEEQFIYEWCSTNTRYAIIGREVGSSGTPHLQGFLILERPQRFSFLQRNLCARLHVEAARGTSQQAAEYCRKEGLYEEFGELPTEQGKRTDIERFVEWVQLNEHRPPEREIARQFPGLYVRYRQSLLDLVEHTLPQPSFPGEPREWQLDVKSRIMVPADDRTIEFVVDQDGGKGKSFLVRHLLSSMPDDVQALSVGKRDDLAFAIDPTKSIFLFDIPRRGMEFFQYNVVEKIKDRVIFSSKYKSVTKILSKDSHVIVFCNEYPDMEAMTADRYLITNI
jgi:Putative viral replication protein